jgi:cephalosporin hydroxylase
MQEVVDRFHVLWYETRQRQTWRNTSWRGVPAQQCPFDLWVYQELIASVRPDTVVEVGTKRGGTTLFLANVFDCVYGRDEVDARVIGVDISMRVHESVSQHPRVRLVEGDSVAPETFERVRASSGSRAMVLLDSDHSAPHVLSELRLYSRLVAPGSYLIVGDTNIAGHPVLAARADGPWDAVTAFLEETDEFEPDPACEKHMLTQSPRGYLKRRGD